jgi:phage antirepressor YoqD-like protein
MDLIRTNQAPTMTSREMADLVEKRHDSVKRTIEALAARGAIGAPHSVEYLDSLNRPAHEYKVGKRDSYVIVAQLSPEFTARLVDRWQELEAGALAALPNFSDPVAAARAWADAKEREQVALVQIEQQQAQIEQARPAVEFVDRFVEAKSSKCLSDVAKLLGWKPQAFIAKLNADTVIFKRGGNWLPFQAHIDAGRFSVKAGEASGHAFQQTRVEPAGIAWLASRYPAPAKV